MGWNRSGRVGRVNKIATFSGSGRSFVQLFLSTILLFVHAVVHLDLQQRRYAFLFEIEAETNGPTDGCDATLQVWPSLARAS